MKFWMACGVGVALLMAGPASAQIDSREGIALQNQILKLQNDVQNLRSEVGRGGGSSSFLGSGSRPAPQPNSGADELTPQLLGRVDRLEDSVRQLNGRLDELANAQQRGQADLAKQIADLQFRLDNGGGAAAPAAGGNGGFTPMSPPPASLGVNPAGPPPTAPAAPPRRTPEMALQEGNAALARRDYITAEANAREVLNAAKGTPRGYDAQFLLAQSLLGQKNYAQSAVAYDDTFNRNKQGNRAQDSLLGLAVSLNALDQKRSACAALDSLQAQFPTPRSDIAQHEMALRATAGCR